VSEDAIERAIGDLRNALGGYEKRWLGPVGAWSGSSRSLDYAAKDNVLRELENVRSLINEATS